MARWTFKGWDVVKWLKGNKDPLKLLIAVVVGFFAASSTPVQLVVGAVAKGLLDIVDYYASK